jgi:hypothetical protein
MGASCAGRMWPDEDCEDHEDARDVEGMLTITPITRLEDIIPETAEEAAAWRNIARQPARREPSDPERALAASYEKYADQLAEIEALRRNPQLR